MEPTQITAKPSRSLIPRVLAPLALVLVAIVMFAIIDSSLDSDDSPAGDRARTTRQQQPPERQTPPQESTYVVQAGDTLGAIAEKTGVPIERLLDLNPDIDPQALTPGAELKLR